MQARMELGKANSAAYRAMWQLEHYARGSRLRVVLPQTISNNQRGQVEARLVLGWQPSYVVRFSLLR
jgi:hypothetical protein